MKELSVREMRQGYQALQKALDEEGEVVLTHHGKPFARVLPLEPRKEIPSHAALRATMPFQEVPSEVLIREDRDAR
jgi:antitoxin (DNA-binding transcriptional repressor) of toxin-antitoxin stability system